MSSWASARCTRSTAGRWDSGSHFSRRFHAQKDGTGNWTFDIVGTWKDTEDENEDNSQLLITHYTYVNESLPEGPARDTMNLAVLRIADPTRLNGIEQKIDAQYTNSSNETLTQSEKELVEAEVANFGDINTVAHRIVGATLFVAALCHRGADDAVHP